MAGSAAVASAANMAGGAQAVIAAAKLASQDSSSSADLVSRMSGIGNGAFDSGASSNASSASTISPLAAAMGDTFASQFTGTRNIGKQSGSTISHLASGINQVVGDKIQTRINQSIGGQIASAINQSSDTQALSNKGTRQVFDNNSLSGEQSSTDDSRADEIAAFRDG
jgi:type IV secretion system protein VirB6/type IV secretion system protein TrbL